MTGRLARNNSIASVAVAAHGAPARVIMNGSRVARMVAAMRGHRAVERKIASQSGSSKSPASSPYTCGTTSKVPVEWSQVASKEYVETPGPIR